MEAMAVSFSMARTGGCGGDLAEAEQARRVLAGFRELYRCLTARADELSELADAVLCADGPVRVLVGCRWPRGTGGVTTRFLAR